MSTTTSKVNERTRTPEYRDGRYTAGETSWDSGTHSAELEAVLGERSIAPCKTLELGCGSGNNAVWLAQRGFDVSACDISNVALEQARTKAAQAGVSPRLFQADLLAEPDLGGPYPFVFDRGTYHGLRKADLDGFIRMLERVTEPGSLYLVLGANANEVWPGFRGPPHIRAEELCVELGQSFDVVHLREFRFRADARVPGAEGGLLGWSGLLRRRAERHAQPAIG